jgi:ribosomal protein S18 acetylase RimI-like enzyme
MIRTATLLDLKQIMKIVETSKLDMHSYGNFQWNEDYPKENDFIKDIDEGTLFVYDIEGIIAGIICINNAEPEEYKTANWSKKKQAITLHRLAVSKKFQGQGIAYKLMNHANTICAQNEIDYLKTDTNSLNVKTQALLRKCGYSFTGEITFIDHPGIFYCYEKTI